MSQDLTFSFKTLEWRKILQVLGGLTSSELGGDLVSLLEPCVDRDKIKRRLDINSECLQGIQRGLSFPIDGCSDVHTIITKLNVAGSTLTGEEINKIIINLEISGKMKNSIRNHEADFPELCSLTGNLKPHATIKAGIRKKVDENGAVFDSASPELKKLRRQRNQKQVDLKKTLDSLVKKFSRNKSIREEYYTVRNGRYVFPVKETNAARFQGITHDISSTGSTIFMEPFEIVERNNVINGIKAREEIEIQKILAEITAQLREIAPDLEGNQDILSLLDFHHACGLLAYKLDAQKPRITGSNVLKLVDARHPLLLLNAENSEEVIPMSITLGESFNTLIISGPNAGGKTVTIKTLGLLSLMVQSGLLVPASPDSQFPVFRRIIAEIGDPQSLDDNLSTFSARLLNIKSIVDDLAKDNLILLDELGTGTDPNEGVNLAIAIVKYIGSSSALCVVTTHHGDMKIFASETDKVENGSLAFDKKTLKPTFRLSVGIPGSSYALELTRKTGLPDEIIEETRKNLGEDQLKIEDFIRDLESRISFYTKQTKEVSRKKNVLETLVREYTEKLNNVEKNYREKLEESLKDTESRMVEFNRNFEHLVKEIRENQAAHETILKAKKAIEKEKEHLHHKRKESGLILSEKDKNVEQEVITVGSTVRMKGHDQTGVIVLENKDKNTATVQMNSIKMEINKDLLLIAKPEKGRKVRDSIPLVSVDSELDLRGLLAQDAVETVDHYLSDAIATGLTAVRLIHGKGSGSLRKNIGEFLKHDERISGYRLGVWGEGDTGVTIVKLK